MPTYMYKYALFISFYCVTLCAFVHKSTDSEKNHNVVYICKHIDLKIVFMKIQFWKL